MTFEEKSLKSEIVYENPIFKIREHEVITVNGAVKKRDILEHRGAVAIACITADKKLVMIRQFRKAIEQDMWEIPAGKLEAGEEDKRLEAAQRELREETGYIAKNWEHVMGFYGTIGFCNERIDIYFCEAVEKGPTQFDDSEAIDIFEMDIDELLKMIDNKEIEDGKTIAAILMAARRIEVR